MPENGEDFVLSSQMDQSSWQEDIKVSEHPPQIRITLHEARSPTMFFKESRTVLSHWIKRRMTSKHEMISGVFSGNHISHHAEPSVHVYVPHEGSISISLKCIDVVRRTNTTLDGCIARKSC